MAHDIQTPCTLKKQKKTGYIPTEAFSYLDSERLIQNSDGIPLIYHVNRKTYEKKIAYDKTLSINDPNMRFNPQLSDIDKKDKYHKDPQKHWWLQNQIF